MGDWSNWSIAPGNASGVVSVDVSVLRDASAETWQKFVEPRLIQAAFDRAARIPLETRLQSGIAGYYGHGVLGHEWKMYDKFYWYMKMEFETQYYYEDNKYGPHFSNAEASLMWEFEFAPSSLASAVRDWLSFQPAEFISASDDQIGRLSAAAMADPTVAAAAAYFRRQAAVIAYRHGITPAMDWREQLRLRLPGSAQTDLEIVLSAIRGYGDT